MQVEVDQGLEEPDAAEALRKTLVPEEVEDLRTVRMRTASPGLRLQVEGQEAEAEGREGDHPKAAPGCSLRAETWCFTI